MNSSAVITILFLAYESASYIKEQVIPIDGGTTA
jgi:hypothetical protein